MAQTKMTFSLDEQTLRQLENSAKRTKKAKSAVVREAIAEYHERIGKLSEAERRRLLAALDAIAARPARKTSADDVDHEIREVRRSRKGPGRRHPL